MPEEPVGDGAQSPASRIQWPGRILRVEIALASLFAAAALIAGLYYLKFGRLIDERLAHGPFADTVNIFGAPGVVTTGDRLTEEEFVAQLRRGAYSTSPANPVGWYRLSPGTVEIFPQTNSVGIQPGRIEFRNGTVSRIVSLSDHTSRHSLEFGPQLIANLSGQREKRLMVRYAQIPPSVVNAVISAEDKRFFEHSGIDFIRIVKAAYVDLKEGRKEQGASTLTMQLARSLFLEPDKRWSRKIEELMLALNLEARLTKQQIFEDYANQVYLGSFDSFSVSGFGEAAREYFGKDISQLDNADAALLAGMIQRPSYFNPFRYPDRALERRNLVLSLMRQNGYLSEAEYRQAVSSPLDLQPQETGNNLDAGFFISLLRDELRNRLGDSAGHAHSVYTTLDPELQQAAREAVRQGMASVDRMLAAQGRKKAAAGEPQVALIALDPRTGEIRALVGGRDYSTSQLDHVLTMRQPGSVFKPFVYAAALHTAIQGGDPVFTPASILDDTPASIYFANRVYRPDNFHNQYLGKVTLQTALADSLNSATVQLADQVGYERILEMARAAGLSAPMEPTPALALGAYEASPLEIAEAYTVFANQGVRTTPRAISQVREVDGKLLYQAHTESQPVLDARIAYLMDNMMQEVLRRGTAASVKSWGFELPAAGKTGTTHDGWFAGFTTRLLCVVWVGFDNDHDLRIEGSESALPIWTDFMRRAAAFHRYGDAGPFQAPAGVVSVRICTATGQRACAYCPRTEVAPFVSGTEPRPRCSLHAALRVRPAPKPAPAAPPATVTQATPVSQPIPPSQPTPPSQLAPTTQPAPATQPATVTGSPDAVEPPPPPAAKPQPPAPATDVPDPSTEPPPDQR